jgi:two-component system nitrogen regulation sensor histidine kinase NtrY
MNHQPGRRNFRQNLLFLAALLFLVAGMVSGSRSRDRGHPLREVARFQKVLHKKERLLKEEFKQLAEDLGSKDPAGVMKEHSAGYQELADRHGITIFYFGDRELVYWSDNTIPIPPNWTGRLNKPFISLRNADYVSVIRRVGEGRLLGMIEVKTHYPFENEFLRNGFQKDFDLDEEVMIEFLEGEGTLPVFSDSGTYLFSLDFNEAARGGGGPGALSRTCIILFLVFAMAGLFAVVRQTAGRRRWIWMGLVTLLIPSVVFVLLKSGFVTIFSNSRLFLPDLFASRLFPSLGHLAVVSVSVLVLVSLYYMYGPLGDRISGRLKRGLAILLFAFAALMFLVVEQLLSILVLDSSISFEVHRVTSFSGYSFIGLAVIITWFFSIGLVTDRAIACFDRRWGRVLAAGGGTVTAVFLLAMLLPGDHGSWTGWAGMMLLVGGQLYLRHRQEGRIPFSRYLFLLLFVSAFIVIRLQQYNKIKAERQREVELVKLSSEHDPVAEMLFSELSMAIRNDSVLATFMNTPFIDIDPLVDHLRRNYFSGYWTKYDLQITVCRPDDQVYLPPPDDEWFPCYNFFDEMIESEGIGVPSSDFYFLDNLNGRISYLASIPYYQAASEHRVFIELDSRIFSEELGYPELLLDDRYNAFTPTHFSYARYNRGTLITRDGDYPYRRSVSVYTHGEKTFEQVTLDKYDHSIYNVDSENTIIVGSPSVTLVDNLISFSYIFALNFLLLALFHLFFAVQVQRPFLNWNFKNRIQYSMVGILFLTFALICSGTIVFIIRQYRDKNNDNLKNIMRSVYIELIHKVEFEDDLRNWSSEEYLNLDELLRKFSNVFYSDINLYDENGVLLATSRSEIFDRQLLSERMNRMVYENLSWGSASEYIHDEHIGLLKYMSAYVPLLNSDNKFLAYLNLPYFTQAGVLTRDVTNMVMAIMNIYLILLLVILGASVFLADRITQPLRVIQNRIARVSLGGKNEMIRYDRSDEIRGLVEEYNFMVQELERSAGLLAQSERESAWREMAKQIAHEIKNPLTPMKLNVQHLQRTFEEGKGDPEKVGKIASILIEQIDSLSAIANAFSDFAQMPGAKSARVNLVSSLKNLLQLFETTEKANISLEPGSWKKVYVYADKEQLTRVFINLVKNGLQAIPDSRKGKIIIRLDVEEEEAAVVTVSDNGKGIPEEIRDRLFQPNFTTKSAGMGMGLAISGNIVRSMGGKIWYETVLDRGTSFYVRLPLMVEKTESIKAD